MDTINDLRAVFSLSALIENTIHSRVCLASVAALVHPWHHNKQYNG